jgi:hypothetical protein
VAVRHVVGKQVWQAEFDVVQRRLNFLKGGLATLKPVTKVLNGHEQWCDIVTLRFRFADTFGAAIAFAAQGFGFHLKRFAAFFKRQVVFGVEYEAAPGEIPGNLGCRLSE